MGKGEIAIYEQCLLFNSVFKKLVLKTRKKQGLFKKGSNVAGIIKAGFERELVKQGRGGGEENSFTGSIFSFPQSFENPLS